MFCCPVQLQDHGSSQQLEVCDARLFVTIRGKISASISIELCATLELSQKSIHRVSAKKCNSDLNDLIAFANAGCCFISLKTNKFHGFSWISSIHVLKENSHKSDSTLN